MHLKIKIPISKVEVKDVEDHKIKVRSMNVQGAERTFAYYIPSGLKQNCPIIMACHGAYWNHEVMRRATGFDFERLADEFGFIIVYPDSFSSYWFDGRISFSHPAKNMDLDEGEFLKRIVHYMVTVYGASRKDIFFNGFSNGGMLGFRLAAEKQPMFRGMALCCSHLPHENFLNFQLENSNAPILLINCRGDRVVPFYGGNLNSSGKSNGVVYSCYDTFCKIAGISEIPPGKDFGEYILYKDRKNILIEVKEGGHTIPHPKTSWPPILGKVADFNSTEMIWKYFKKIIDGEI